MSSFSMAEETDTVQSQMGGTVVTAVTNESAVAVSHDPTIYRSVQHASTVGNLTVTSIDITFQPNGGKATEFTTMRWNTVDKHQCNPQQALAETCGCRGKAQTLSNGQQKRFGKDPQRHSTTAGLFSYQPGAGTGGVYQNELGAVLGERQNRKGLTGQYFPG